MKKLIFAVRFLISSLLLTGCELHFADGTRYDLPWQAVLIIIILDTAVIFGVIISLMPKNFWAVCQKCGTRFYVKKRIFSNSSATPEHFDFITKCPHCNRRTMCTRSYDQEDKR